MPTEVHFQQVMFRADVEAVRGEHRVRIGMAHLRPPLHGAVAIQAHYEGAEALGAVEPLPAISHHQEPPVLQADQLPDPRLGNCRLIERHCEVPLKHAVETVGPDLSRGVMGEMREGAPLGSHIDDVLRAHHGTAAEPVSVHIHYLLIGSVLLHPEDGGKRGYEKTAQPRLVTDGGQVGSDIHRPPQAAIAFQGVDARRQARIVPGSGDHICPAIDDARLLDLRAHPEHLIFPAPLRRA